ncbi:hypothetical protein V2J09_008537 [Rumex salicifolius]
MPYGIDFPLGPTGRFTNGKTIADFVGDHLRLPLIPAFSDQRTNGYHIVHGVNYGSGILDATGSSVEGVMGMNRQIKEFMNVTLPELESVVGSNRNNDYGLNYFVGLTPNVAPQAFTQALISNYSDQLKRLYNVGARKFLLVTVYPLGCNPWIREFTNTINGCHQPSNLITRLFYTQLLHFNVTGPCCEVKAAFGNVKLGCKEDGMVCPNRHAYVFFDNQHNTQAITQLTANLESESRLTSDEYREPFHCFSYVVEEYTRYN